MNEVKRLAVDNALEPAVDSILFDAIRRTLVQWRIVVAVACAMLVVVVAVRLLLPRTYTATGSFAPQTRDMSSNLTGLAARFGVTMPASEPSESPQFYADLLHSRELLRSVAESTFEVTPGVNRTLADWYGRKEAAGPLRLDAAEEQLRRDISASVSSQTGVVSFAVRARFPVLAEQIAQRALALVNAFNLERRRSRASSERAFTESRVRDIQSELRAAEGQLQDFLQHNANCCTSPALRFEQERLQRSVTMQQQLFTSMSQAFEQAKIDEVRDTPVITIVEPPSRPVRPDSRHVPLYAAAGIVAGALIGSLLALALEYGHPLVEESAAIHSMAST